MPTNSAPIAAPSIEPRPPMITTAKAMMITLTPMPGETEIIGAVSAPPSAAKKTPIAKETMKTRSTFTPMVWLISRS